MKKFIKNMSLTTLISTPSLYCMENEKISKNASKNTNINNSIENKPSNKFLLLKEKYREGFLGKVFENLHTKRTLNVVKTNKTMQGLLDYVYGIEIEITSDYNIDGTFMNIQKKYKNCVSILIDNKEEDIDDVIVEKSRDFYGLTTKYLPYKNRNKIIIKIGRRVESLKKLFEDIICIDKINILKFNSSNITDMSYMFSGCKYLIDIIDLSKFNTSKVTDMSYMFNLCPFLKKIDLSNFDTKNVTNMSHMFSGCDNIIEFNFGNESELKFNTENVTDMSYMFDGCKSLVNLDVSNLKTSNVIDMSCMFRLCEKIESIKLTKNYIKKENNTNNKNVIKTNARKATGFNDNIKNVTGINTANLSNNDDSRPVINKGETKIKRKYVNNINTKNAININTKNASNFNTKNVTNMSEMFSFCDNLHEILGLNEFITDNVTDMSYMFYVCTSLKKVDLSNANFNKVTNVDDMFYWCKVEHLNLNKFTFNNNINPKRMCFYFFSTVENAVIDNEIIKEKFVDLCREDC